MFREDRDSKKVDLDVLDELIAKCEDSMIQPFKKKKAVAVAIEPEVDVEEEGEKESKPDLEDMDLEELMAMYSELKDRD